MNISSYAKAIVGGLVAFTGSVATGYSDGAMEAGEWWFAASTGLAALALVFGVPNVKNVDGRHEA